jgi:hypothetical protein
MPTEDVNEALCSSILEHLEEAVSRGENGILRLDELRSSQERARNAVDNIFASGSDPWRLGDRLRLTQNRDYRVTNLVYADPAVCREHLQPWIDLFRSALNLPGAAIVSSETTFRPGQRTAAVRAILGILRRATRRILIVDPYIDAQAGEYCSELATDIQLNVLTRERSLSESFWPMFRALRDERYTISVKSTETIHDRYIVVDEGEVWRLGCSIKDAGRRATSISRVASEEEAASMVRYLLEAWDEAGPLEP